MLKTCVVRRNFVLSTIVHKLKEIELETKRWERRERRQRRTKDKTALAAFAAQDWPRATGQEVDPATF